MSETSSSHSTQANTSSLVLETSSSNFSIPTTDTVSPMPTSFGTIRTISPAPSSGSIVFALESSTSSTLFPDSFGVPPPRLSPSTSLTFPTIQTISSASTVSTLSASHPSQNLANTQSLHLKAAQIAAIAVSAGLVGICIIGAAICLIIRRRRSRSGHGQKGLAPSQNVDANTLEKYGGAAQYTYSKYQEASAETKGTLPLLKASFDKRSSRQSGEFGQYHDLDAPPSPYFHEECESTHTPLAHAVPLADAIPSGRPSAEAQFDHVDLIPVSQSSTPKASAPALPPIVIPEQQVLTRKPTKGKRISRSGSKHTYRAVDAGDLSDVDSESMYSQSSAYTVQSASSPQDRQMATIHDFLLATIPGTPHSTTDNKHDSTSTIQPGDISRASIVRTLTHDPEVVITRRQDSDEAPMEDAVLVAKLLKSRGKLDQPPTRSDSVVSHIERKGSIRPAYQSSSGEEIERQRIRSLRAMRKSQTPGAGMTRPEETPQQTLNERVDASGSL